MIKGCEFTKQSLQNFLETLEFSKKTSNVLHLNAVHLSKWNSQGRRTRVGSCLPNIWGKPSWETKKFAQKIFLSLIKNFLPTQSKIRSDAPGNSVRTRGFSIRSYLPLKITFWFSHARNVTFSNHATLS